MAPMRMLKSNFEIALTMALEAARERDKKAEITKSIFTAGLEDVLQASRNGHHIYISEE